jgi:hypothetical protein
MSPVLMEELHNRQRHESSSLPTQVRGLRETLERLKREVAHWTSLLPPKPTISDDQQSEPIAEMYSELLQSLSALHNSQELLSTMIQDLMNKCSTVCDDAFLLPTSIMLSDPQLDNEYAEIDLQYLLSLLLNDFNQWVVSTVLSLISFNFKGHSFVSALQGVEKICQINQESLHRVVISQTLDSNMRWRYE